jgi:Tn3 transposase DDE domain-containing protein
VLSHVRRWTDFVSHFGHVSSGLPPDNERTFLAALIAEATNLGLSRMAAVCGVASRRALLRMQTWHMREETFRAALGCLTGAEGPSARNRTLRTPFSAHFSQLAGILRRP